jgi:photosystem II stability/assembly factor-like uncharacterized protein
MTGLDRRYTIPLLVSSQRPDRLYTAAAAGPPPTWRHSANAALYRTDDGGQHWVQLKRGLPPQFDVMVQHIAVNADGNIFIAAGSELFFSHDEGDSWERLQTELTRVQALVAV